MEPKETYINSKVRRLAEYLAMDPEVAQDLYSKSDLDNAIDSLDHKHRKEEIQDLQSLRKSILKHAYKFEHYDIIQTAYRIDGFDLNKTLIDLLDNLDDMIGFGEHKRRLETTGTRANKRAHEVARYVAALFEAEGRNVGYGVDPYDGEAPSTPFGHAVKKALSIFNVRQVEVKIANWRFPAEKAAAEYRSRK